MKPPTPAVRLSEPARLDDQQRQDLLHVVARVLDGGWLIGGPEVEAFEDEFSAMMGVAGCVGVGNGTDALEVALRAVGVAPGDRVATVANAGFYASSAILAIGAAPVFVDVDARSLQMDPARLAEVIPGLSAVVLTHLYGDARAAPAIAGVCARAGVPLVEDCAQAAGAVVDDRAAGAFGQAGAFSFYPTKNLAAIGDGGAVVSTDAAVVDGARRIARHGWRGRFEVVTTGRNSRLDAVQAAVLRHRLPGLAAENERRRAIWRRYRDAIDGSRLRMVGDADGPWHVAHLTVLSAPDVTVVRTELTRAGIDTDVHYPYSDDRQPLVAARRLNAELPVTHASMGHVVSLPCFPTMTPFEVDRVTAALSGVADLGG